MLDISVKKLTLRNFVTMRNNSQDLTLERNYLEKYRFLIKEYEQVKNKTHSLHSGAMDFYKANDTCRKSFLKYLIALNKAENPLIYYLKSEVQNIKQEDQ